MTRSIHISQMYFSIPTTNTMENEIKLTVPFVLESKNMKYLGVNLMKGLQTLLREIKEHLNKWRDTLHSWIVMTGDLILLRSPLLPNGDLDSMKFQSKPQQVFFVKIGTLIPVSIWKCGGPRIAKTKRKKWRIYIIILRLTIKLQ